MNHIRQALDVIRHREDGATAVEYAIMVALIAAVIIAAVTVLGTSTSNSFCESAQDLGSASTC